MPGDSRPEREDPLGDLLGGRALVGTRPHRTPIWLCDASSDQWAVPGSNGRPPACKAGALPAELTARWRRGRFRAQCRAGEVPGFFTMNLWRLRSSGARARPKPSWSARCSPCSSPCRFPGSLPRVRRARRAALLALLSCGGRLPLPPLPPASGSGPSAGSLPRSGGALVHREFRRSLPGMLAVVVRVLRLRVGSAHGS